MATSSVSVTDLLGATSLGKKLSGKKTHVFAILMIAHAVFTLVYGDPGTGATFDNPGGGADSQLAIAEGLFGGAFSTFRMGVTKLQRVLDALNT